MSIFRKIMMALIFIVVAGISTWLRYGDMAAAKQWLLSRPPPRVEVVASPSPQEEALPVHVSYGGSGAAPRDSVMVLHFRRPDTSDETMAKAVVQVFDGDGTMQRDVTVWGTFRHEVSLGASIARFTIGSFPPGSYRVAADIGSRQPLGIRRAAIEFSLRDSEPIWTDLTKVK